jgi:hypothetical protein
VHGLLLAAADVPQPPLALRRPSMCHDGTPLVYSVALDGDRPSPFRLLVEPGGTGIDVPAQVDCALDALDRGLAICGWDRAGAGLRTIASIVFPGDREAMRRWWGGAWIGLVLSPEALEMRLYANLRWGDARARWQRACDAICAFADERLTPTLEDLMARVAPVAVPVGLGVAISGDALRALRLYAGVHSPTPEAIEAALPRRIAGGAEPVGALAALFEERFGAMPPQSVTLGYDFLLAENRVQPGVARTKVDVSCQLIDDDRRDEAWDLAHALADRLGTDLEELDEFERALGASFGGSQVEFVSLGLRERATSMSVYAKPDDFRPVSGAG